MRERVKRGSASETYIFLGLKILVKHIHATAQCSSLLLPMLWRYKRQLVYQQNTYIEKMYVYMRASLDNV